MRVDAHDRKRLEQLCRTITLLALSDVVFDNVARFPRAIAELSGYLKAGQMKSKEASWC